MRYFIVARTCRMLPSLVSVWPSTPGRSVAFAAGRTPAASSSGLMAYQATEERMDFDSPVRMRTISSIGKGMAQWRPCLRSISEPVPRGLPKRSTTATSLGFTVKTHENTKAASSSSMQNLTSRKLLPSASVSAWLDASSEVTPGLGASRTVPGRDFGSAMGGRGLGAQRVAGVCVFSVFSRFRGGIFSSRISVARSFSDSFSAFSCSRNTARSGRCSNTA